MAPQRSNAAREDLLRARYLTLLKGTETERPSKEERRARRRSNTRKRASHLHSLIVNTTQAKTPFSSVMLPLLNTAPGGFHGYCSSLSGGELSTPLEKTKLEALKNQSYTAILCTHMSSLVKGIRYMSSTVGSDVYARTSRAETMERFCYNES